LKSDNQNFSKSFKVNKDYLHVLKSAIWCKIQLNSEVLMMIHGKELEAYFLYLWLVYVQQLKAVEFLIPLWRRMALRVSVGGVKHAGSANRYIDDNFQVAFSRLFKAKTRCHALLKTIEYILGTKKCSPFRNNKWSVSIKY